MLELCRALGIAWYVGVMLSMVQQLVKQLALQFLACLGRRLHFTRPLVPSRIQKILVIQTGGIGDCLLLFPAIQALHEAFPLASITMVTEQWPLVAPLFPLNHVVTESVLLDFQGRHRGFLGKLRLIRELRKQSFDLIYCPSRGHGMSENSIITFLIGSPYRIGFRQAGAGFLNTTSLELHPDQPLLSQNLALLAHAGIAVRDREVCLDIPDEATSAVETCCRRWDISDRALLIAVHPGARWQANLKTWPLERFATLMHILLRDYQATIFLLGSATDRSVWTQIKADLSYPRLIDTMGQLTLAETAALVRRSTLFIGNDSGPLHIATALRIPSVAIFGSTSPTQILSPTSHCMVVRKGIACSPCYTHQAFYTQPKCQVECLNWLSVEEVLEAVVQVIHNLTK